MSREHASFGEWRVTPEATPDTAPRAVDWLAEFVAAPIALVKNTPRPRCNGALMRLLDHESDSGKRRLRDALKALASAMLEASAAGAGQPAIDDRALSLRTSTSRYRFEPVQAPHGAGIAGIIHVRRSRTAPDRASLTERFGLTPREAEVAELVARGCSNKSVAAELGLSPHTVKRHTESVFAKVGVSSRAALAARIHPA